VADVKIRKLDDWVVMSLKAQAKAAGRSLEEELRHVLREAALAPQRAFARKSREIVEEMRAKYGETLDSTPLIREDRDSRG